MEKISVIVPVYKVEKYLQRCIESIINQTYKNLEIILIDDGSPDNCGIICDEYAKKDNRIKVIHKENGGLSDARNAGLDIATGEYIAFVDSDDYIALNMFETLHSLMIKDNSDMALCEILCVDECGNSIESMNAKSPIKDGLYNQKEFFEKVSSYNGWHLIIACNKLYKKEIFQEIRFPKGRYCEDNYVIHYIIEKTNKVSCLDTPLYFYVQRNNSIMHFEKYSIKNFDDVEGYFDRALLLKKYNLIGEMYKTTLSGIQRMDICCCNLDLKDINIRKRYKELRSLYKLVYKNLIFERGISFKKKFLLTFFYIDIRAYRFFINAYSSTLAKHI